MFYSTGPSVDKRYVAAKDSCFPTFVSNMHCSIGKNKTVQNCYTFISIGLCQNQRNSYQGRY
jgi:hypothetical protein